MRQWVLFIGMLGVGSLPVARVSAQLLAEDFELTYEAPSDCPEREAIVASVSRLVSTAGSEPETLKAQIHVAHQRASQYVLRLKTEHNGILGERVFHGRSCQAVSDAAIVTLALMLNPDAHVLPDVAPQVAAPAPPVAHAQVPSPMAPVGARQERQAGVVWFATSSLGLHVGILPDPGLELSLGTGLSWRRASVWLRAGYAPTEKVQLAAQPNFGARLWAGSVAVLGCWSLSEGFTRVGPCLGLDVTRVQGHGTGVSHSRTAVTAWTSPVLGIFTDLALKHHVALRLNAAVNVPLNRPDTHLDDLGSVQRPSRVGGRLDAGMIWHWP